MVNNKVLLSRFILPLITMLFFLISCADPNSGSASKDVSISYIDCITINVDETYWATSTPGRTVCYEFIISYSQNNLVADDFESIKITDPNGIYWLFNSEESMNHYNSTSNKWRGYWIWYDQTPDRMATGQYTIEVTLKNGKNDSNTYSILDPGTINISSDSWLYSQHYSGSTPAGYKELPGKADNIIASCNSENTEISIDFTINDSDIYGGYIQFFDLTGAYMGTSRYYFKNYNSAGTVNPKVNSGVNFYNNGTQNSIIYSDTDIIFSNNKTIADIGSLHILLTDGAQNITGSETFNTLTISEQITVTHN